MPESGFQSVITRAWAQGPWLVSLVLAALIAVELARIVLGFLGGTPLQEISGTSRQQRKPAGALPALDLTPILSGHLFGIAAAGDSPANPGDAPASTSNLVLAGTIATQDPRHGIAIISDGGPSRVYSVGDAVGGGARLHSVYMDRVLLDRGGTLESLTLPRTLDGRTVAAPKATGVFGPNSRVTTVAENLRRRVQQEPGFLNEIMRTVPSYDNRAGKLRGFRAYPGRNRIIFSKLGLKPGDLVTAINGTPLDDPQHSQEVLNTIQNSDHATVTIDRAGQRQDITLNLVSVAQQASQELNLEGSSDSTGNASAGQSPPPAPTPAPGNEDTNTD